MSPPSLRQLCTATAIRNVKYLNDIGNIPYSLARPFLLKIESPEKLRSIEQNSPHIIDEDGELWLEFIKRDIPKWDEYELSDQSDCCYDVYCDLQEHVQKSLDEDAEKLKMALDGINSERAEKSAKFVDRRTMRLPRERPTTKQRHAQFDRRMGGIKPVFSAQRSSLVSSDPMGTPNWSFERPSMPRPETKKKNSIFNATKRNNVLAVPTKQLNNRASQVKQAPRSLIEEHRRPAEPAVPRRKDSASPALRAPGRSNSHSTAAGAGNLRSTVNPSLREKEARLRSIASGQRPDTKSQAGTRTSTPGAYGSTGSETNYDTDKSKSSEQAPRPPMIRKRPPPSVFVQPKRKRIS